MTTRYNPSQLSKISIEYSAVCKLWEVFTKEKGYIDNRQRCNIIIKHSFSVACRKHTSLSLSEIGGVINKDHATVLHACRNHDSNCLYLNNYKSTYTEIESRLLQTMYYKDDVAQAEALATTQELRNRLVATSQRLRQKIYEIKHLKEHSSTLPYRIERENLFLKKHAKEVHDRNKKLEKELARIKNLI